jgi:hypothetical protein
MHRISQIEYVVVKALETTETTQSHDALRLQKKWVHPKIIFFSLKSI